MRFVSPHFAIRTASTRRRAAWAKWRPSLGPARIGPVSVPRLLSLAIAFGEPAEEADPQAGRSSSRHTWPRPSTGLCLSASTSREAASWAGSWQFRSKRDARMIRGLGCRGRLGFRRRLNSSEHLAPSGGCPAATSASGAGSKLTTSQKPSLLYINQGEGFASPRGVAPRRSCWMEAQQVVFRSRRHCHRAVAVAGPYLRATGGRTCTD